jgi:hypothetical protein
MTHFCSFYAYLPGLLDSERACGPIRCLRQVCRAHSGPVRRFVGRPFVGYACGPDCRLPPRNPIHLCQTAMSQLAHQGDVFQTPEAFLDSRSLSLADCVTGMPCRASVDSATAAPPCVARHVRRHTKMTAPDHELCRVKTLVTADRHAPRSGDLLQHQQRGIPLCASVGLQQLCIHDQTVAILHQQTATVAQLRLLARALARQLRIWIGLRRVRLIAAVLTVKIHGRISWIVRRPRTILFSGLKTLKTRPGFQQLSVHREVLIRCRPSAALAEPLRSRIASLFQLPIVGPDSL